MSQASILLASPRYHFATSIPSSVEALPEPSMPGAFLHRPRVPLLSQPSSSPPSLGDFYLLFRSHFRSCSLQEALLMHPPVPYAHLDILPLSLPLPPLEVLLARLLPATSVAS